MKILICWKEIKTDGIVLLQRGWEIKTPEEADDTIRILYQRGLAEEDVLLLPLPDSGCLFSDAPPMQEVKAVIDSIYLRAKNTGEGSQSAAIAEDLDAKPKTPFDEPEREETPLYVVTMPNAPLKKDFSYLDKIPKEPSLREPEKTITDNEDVESAPEQIPETAEEEKDNCTSEKSQNEVAQDHSSCSVQESSVEEPSNTAEADAEDQDIEDSNRPNVLPIWTDREIFDMRFAKGSESPILF